MGIVFCFVEFFVNEVDSKLEFIEVMKDIEVVENKEGRFDVCVIGYFKLVV